MAGAIVERFFGRVGGNFRKVRRAEAFSAWGSVVWENPLSRSTIANIAEFAYKRDARFFLTLRPGNVQQISSGKLWNTRTEWKWRIWSVNSAGDISFSEVVVFCTSLPI